MSPDLALQKALIAHLRADGPLNALVGQRIHDEEPQERIYPFVTLTRAEVRPWGGLDGEGTEHAQTLAITSRFEGTEEAKAIVAAVRTALHDASPSLDSWRLVNLRVAFADVFRAADWRSTIGVVRLRAVVEPL